MDNVMKNRLRKKYVELNRKFLNEVEKGASWESLQPLMDEMKEISACLEQYSSSAAIIRNISTEISPEQQVV